MASRRLWKTKTASPSIRASQLLARTKTGDGPRSGCPMPRGISTRLACRISATSERCFVKIRKTLARADLLPRPGRGTVCPFHLCESGTAVACGEYLSRFRVHSHGVGSFTGGEGANHAVVPAVDGRDAVTVHVRDINDFTSW